MAYIASFVVSGLAGRQDDYAVTLRQDVNVFFGINGSGKTSLLKILHSALTLDASILPNVPFERAEVRIVAGKTEVTAVCIKPPLDSRQGELFSSLGSLASIGTVQPRISWSIESSRTVPSRGFSHAYLPTTRLLAATKDDPNRNPFSYNPAPVEEQFDTRFAELLERLWTDYYFEVLWSVRAAQERGLTDLLLGTLRSSENQAGGQGADVETIYQRVESFLQRQQSKDKSALDTLEKFRSRYESDAAFRQVANHVERVERRIEAVMRPSNKLDALVQRLFGEKKVRFEQKGLSVVLRNHPIPLASLSSGEKQLLQLFIQAMPIRQGSQDPIIIDEPEISLHVDWQRCLLASLRDLAPQSQLIIATHSPEIMAEVPDDRIFRI
jgi:predicted ATPase